MLEFLGEVGKLREKILKKGIGERKLAELVRQRQEGFAGLLSEEAALVLIAKDSGIELSTLSPPPRFERIAALSDGMRANVRGKVERIYPLKLFEKDGRKGSLVSMVLNDGSGAVRLVLWGLDAEKVERGGIQKGDEIEVLNATVKQGFSGLELQFGMTGSMKRIEGAGERQVAKISSLKEGGEFDLLLRVLEVGKRSLFEKNGKMAEVAWILAGDGSGTARLVLWDSLASLVEKLKVNDIVKVENGIARGAGEETEVHAGWGSRLLINPKGGEVAGDKQAGALLRKISELAEGEAAEVKAALVDVSSVRDIAHCAKCGEVALLDICPGCGSKELKVSRSVEATFSDGEMELEAEFKGKPALKLFCLKSLADDISTSTVAKLKKKMLIGKEYYLLGKLENGVFRVENASLVRD